MHFIDKEKDSAISASVVASSGEGHQEKFTSNIL